MDEDKKLNQLVARWRKRTQEKLKAAIPAAGIQHSAKSKSPVAAADAIKTSQKQKFGVVSSVSFNFPRHMVFVEKGVSRGHPISNPRKAKPWFNKVIETEIEKLADIVAENAADKIISDSFERLKIR